MEVMNESKFENPGFDASMGHDKIVMEVLICPKEYQVTLDASMGP